MKLIGYRAIKISVILSFLLLSGCSQNVIYTDNFEKNYDFDVYDHIKIASWVEEETTLNEVIKSFQDRYPHVEIEIVNFPSQTYDDYFDVMTDPLEGFDVMLLSGGFYSTLIDNNELYDLSHFIEKDEIDLSVFGTLLNDTGELTYALPYRNSVFLLYYNKTLFDQAGIDYPDKNFTWEKFESAARTLTSGEGEDKVWGAFIQNYSQLWTIQSIQDGNSILDDDLSAFEKSIEFTLGLVEAGYVLSPDEIIERDLVQNGSIKFFGSGQVAMMPMGEWTAKQLLEADNIDFDWAVAEMPYPQGGRSHVTLGLPVFAGILNSSNSKAIAFEFIKTLSGPSGASIVAKQGSIPALLTDNTRASYLKGKDEDLDLRFFLEAQTESFSPYHPKSFEISALFDKYIADVLNKKIDPSDAIDQIYLERIDVFNH